MYVDNVFEKLLKMTGKQKCVIALLTYKNIVSLHPTHHYTLGEYLSW